MKVSRYAPLYIFSASLMMMMFIFMMMMFISGCKKQTAAPTFTVDDAAVVVTNAVNNTGGMSAEITLAASASPESLPCNAAQNTTVEKNYATPQGTFYYNAPWSYSAKCNGNSPLLVNITGSYSGGYNISQYNSSCTGTRNWALTGLGGSASSPYIFNGTYTRKGVQQFKTGSELSYTSNVTVTLTNVTVDKSTYLITGGNGTVVVDVLFDNNQGYMNLTGNIIFNGNNTATLTLLPQTHTYTINL